MKLTFANKVTIARILSVPFFITTTLYYSPVRSYLRYVALAIFLLAIVTDAIDGYIARTRHQKTKAGAILDPLADKLLVCTALILLVALGRVEGWIIAVILGREMAVTTLRGIAGAEGVVIAANRLGKFKNLAQLSATGILILHYDYFFLKIHLLGTILIWIALVLTVWSGIHYFVSYLRRS